MSKTTNTATILNGTIIVNSATSQTSITSSGNYNLGYASGGLVWSDRSHIDDVKDYIDFALELMGIDLDFHKFSRMTSEEKRAMIREMKIDKIID